MAKRIEKDGKFYRYRRGVLVEIPPEWVGSYVTTRRRNSKKVKKLINAEPKLNRRDFSREYLMYKRGEGCWCNGKHSGL